jgi:thiamine biosynthesis lipoprotein
MTDWSGLLQARAGRRDVVVAGLGVFLVGAVPILARRRSRIVRRSLPVMGTVAEVAVLHVDPERAQGAIDDAFAALRRVERLMSRFTADSDVGRANAAAGRWAVPVANETAGVVAAALAWADAADGRFDPALGLVSEIWDVSNRHEPPPASAIRRLAGRRLHRAVDAGTWRGAPAVWLRDPDVHLDLGGIAKGHGIDCAVAALRERGIDDGIVTVGGDLYALGRRPDGEPWRVGIRSPEDPSRLIGSIDLSDAAVATSGDYERLFRYRGVVYHHLMDPATAAPVRSPRHCVTVRASACLDADAAATAVFGMEADGARALLARAGRGGVDLVRVG